MALEVEEIAVQLIRPRLRHNVDKAARGASEFRRGILGNDLELFDGLQRDADLGSLAPQLFAEERIVVVPPIDTDVVVDPSLAVEVYFVPVRSLNDADARRERRPGRRRR